MGIELEQPLNRKGGKRDKYRGCMGNCNGRRNKQGGE
jgi:hypothetical protein